MRRREIHELIHELIHEFITSCYRTLGLKGITK